MIFKNDKTYAACNNPDGALSLPVGMLLVKPKGQTEYVFAAYTDDVDGKFLNEIQERYGELERVKFRSRCKEIDIL